MKEKIKNEYAVKNGFDDWDDLLCNALPDFVRFSINEVMELFVNQEVERRIKERMPSEIEITVSAHEIMMNYLTNGNPNGDFKKSTIGADDNKQWWVNGVKWLRSRLTKGDDKKKPDNAHTCTVCHTNWVDSDNGYDTCDDCLNKV